jgi:hypothetical protein
MREKGQRVISRRVEAEYLVTQVKYEVAGDKEMPAVRGDEKSDRSAVDDRYRCKKSSPLK